MIRAVIVEDEAVSARRMQRLLEKRNVSVIKILNSNVTLETYLEGADRPDVFFMDIHLSDGVVFDLLKRKNIETPIIFTTAYDQYAIKAFKQNSVDYLLKPIDEEELDNAIAKFSKSLKQVNLSELTSLLAAQNKTNSYKERISVKVGPKIRSILISEVLFFYSADKVNFLYNKEGRAYPIDYSIEEIHKLLDPKEYYRVSRSYVVAISAIQDVLAYTNSRLKVLIPRASDHEIIVARDRVKDFKAWLG